MWSGARLGGRCLLETFGGGPAVRVGREGGFQVVPAGLGVSLRFKGQGPQEECALESGVDLESLAPAS